MSKPLLALTQGDPAGIGPEICLRVLAEWTPEQPWRPLLIAEWAALQALRPSLPEAPWERLLPLQQSPQDTGLSDALGSWQASGSENQIPVLDPVGARREVTLGQPVAADARGALAALDLGIDLAQRSLAQALVTAPLNKAQIAEHLNPDFRGHTDYLATACSLRRYGEDYLMAFLTPSLDVALLSTHVSLSQAIGKVDRESVLMALRLMGGHVQGKIAVAGLNPHAGEGGLMGREEIEQLAPAVAAARAEGIDAHGPESPDTLFARAAGGEFDWVLALYHDQGLIPVKTAAFGEATNWTLGLPFLRTSVDHGTAYDIAGRGRADPSSLRAVLTTTLRLLG